MERRSQKDEVLHQKGSCLGHCRKAPSRRSPRAWQEWDDGDSRQERENGAKSTKNAQLLVPVPSEQEKTKEPLCYAQSVGGASIAKNRIHPGNERPIADKGD